MIFCAFLNTIFYEFDLKIIEEDTVETFNEQINTCSKKHNHFSYFRNNIRGETIMANIYIYIF